MRAFHGRVSRYLTPLKARTTVSLTGDAIYLHLVAADVLLLSNIWQLKFQAADRSGSRSTTYNHSRHHEAVGSSFCDHRLLGALSLQPRSQGSSPAHRNLRRVGESWNGHSDLPALPG